MKIWAAIVSAGLLICLGLNFYQVHKLNRSGLAYSQLRKAVTEQQGDISNILQVVSDANSNNLVLCLQLVNGIAESSNQVAKADAAVVNAVFSFSDRVTALETEVGSITNYLTSKIAKTTYRPAYAPASGQMPANVAAQIRADAEQKWPNQFDMQVYEINQQTEAWHKLNP